jgi:hypothetical protein
MRLDRKIHEAVKYEEEKRFRQLKLITVGLGLLGVGTLGAVVTNYVDRAIEARTEQLTDQTALFQFVAMATNLEKTDSGLSDESRQKLLKIMRRLADNQDLSSPFQKFAHVLLRRPVSSAGSANSVSASERSGR